MNNIRFHNVGPSYVATNGSIKLNDKPFYVRVGVDITTGYAVTAYADIEGIGILKFSKQDAEDLINVRFPETIRAANKDVVLVQEIVWEEQAQERARQQINDEINNGYLPSFNTWREAGYGKEEYNVLQLLFAIKA